MKRVNWALIARIGLIAIGALSLLGELGVASIPGLAIPVLFGLTALAFLCVYFTMQVAWWTAFLAGGLLGVAAMMGWGVVSPDQVGTVAPALFTAAPAVAFWALYLKDRDKWWAIVAGCVLLTLALRTGLSPVLGDSLGIEGVLFLGLGVTFLALYFVRLAQDRLQWALVAAGVLLLLGLILLLNPDGLLADWAPAAVLALGLYLVSRMLQNSTRT